MLVIPYIFLMITVEPSSINVTPYPAVSAEQCQAMVARVRERGQANTVAYCVPHGATLQLDTETGPSS